METFGFKVNDIRFRLAKAFLVEFGVFVPKHRDGDKIHIASKAMGLKRLAEGYALKQKIQQFFKP
jgi:hypothetical protein